MFLRFTLHSAHAFSVQDHPNDPFNKRSEFYQTWQLAELEPLVPLDEDPKTMWARQGFSVTSGPDDGVSFANGDSRVLDDPSIAFVLPAMNSGEIRRFRLDLHVWESDSSSEKVRAAFTDSTLKVLLKAWKDSREDMVAAQKSLESWLRGNAADLVKMAVAAASVTAQSWVSVGLAALPLFELIVQTVRSNSDDYVGMHRFIIEVKREGADTHWRVATDGTAAIPDWITGEGLLKLEREIRDASGRNHLQNKYVCMVMH